MHGRLVAAHNEQAGNWKSFRQSYPPPQNCLLPDASQGEFQLQRDLMKAMRHDRKCNPADGLLALKLLAVLHNRIRSSAKNPADDLIHPRLRSVNTLVTELRYLETHENDDFAKFVARMIEERVLRRHLWVGLRKLRDQGDYTFLIEA